MDHMAALKRKHLLEAKEEELRRGKEQFALETELAAVNAKLHVLEINSKCGCKTSGGINSYFERNRALRTSGLNPHAEHFVPLNGDENITSEARPAQPVTIRLKQIADAQTDIRPAISNIPEQVAHDNHLKGHTSHLSLSVTITARRIFWTSCKNRMTPLHYGLAKVCICSASKKYPCGWCSSVEVLVLKILIKEQPDWLPALLRAVHKGAAKRSCEELAFQLYSRNIKRKKIYFFHMFFSWRCSKDISCPMQLFSTWGSHIPGGCQMVVEINILKIKLHRLKSFVLFCHQAC